jgi:hypothetical protein
MTYQNDPNRDFESRAMDRRRVDDGWGMGSILLASLAALAIVFGIFYALNRGDTTTANRTGDRPAVSTTTTTSPAETTGSGATTTPRPVNPTPSTTPAPATPAPANR